MKASLIRLTKLLLCYELGIFDLLAFVSRFEQYAALLAEVQVIPRQDQDDLRDLILESMGEKVNRSPFSPPQRCSARKRRHCRRR